MTARRTQAKRGPGRKRSGPSEAGRDRSGSRARARSTGWERLDDDALLARPIRSLGLAIEGTALEARLGNLYAELERAGLRFRPYVWLSTDWFAPDGHSGFAVPFFLAHPRLARLERRHMLEVEGGSQDWCIRLLRHETAHALDNAYRLHRRKRWRETFGPFSRPYRRTYVPHPTSRSYVQNLSYWYAQSHPSEDFAETFAVWLQPRSCWRERYRGWPALKKLEFVDALMHEIADEPAPIRTRARPDSVGQLSLTLREYYRRKQAIYREDHGDEYDASLRRVFSADQDRARRDRASRFLDRSRRELRAHVSLVTGQHPYVIDQVINDLVLRCRRLDLRLVRSEHETLLECTALLTALTTTFTRMKVSEYTR